MRRPLSVVDVVIIVVLTIFVAAATTIYIDYVYGDEVLNPTQISQAWWNQAALSAVNQIPYGSMAQVPGNVIAGNASGSLGDIGPLAMPSCSTAGSALTWTTNSGIGCNTAIAAATVNGFTPNPVLTGVTGSMGGGLLTVGSCATGTASVTGAAVGMVAMANPTAYQGDGVQFQAYVSSANTVTVKACALLLITPSATTYNVRVLQ